MRAEMAEKNKVIKVDFGAKRVIDPPEAAPPEVEEDAPAALHGKKKVASMNRLLEKGTVMVTLDSRHNGVVVPPAHKGKPNLNLNFDWDFQIPDFEVTEDGISASLSFGGRDFWCNIPWDAAYMLRSMVDDELVVFPHSFPAELRAMNPALMAELEREMDDED